MIAVEGFNFETISRNKAQILEKYKGIFQEPNNSEFFEAITSGTSSKNKLIKRIEFIKEVFSSVLG